MHVVFLGVQTVVWLPVFGIFNVCTGFDAGNGTQELCTNVVGESALIVDAGRKNLLPHMGLEPMSALCLAFQSDAVPTELSRPLT